MTGNVRKSVPLSPADLDGLRALRTDLAWREVAMEITGADLSATPSEAEALHALVEVGRRVIEARVAEAEGAAERETEQETEQDAEYAAYVAYAKTITDEDRAITRGFSLRSMRRNDAPYDEP
jgi:hypothetical protein